MRDEYQCSLQPAGLPIAGPKQPPVPNPGLQTSPGPRQNDNLFAKENPQKITAASRSPAAATPNHPKDIERSPHASPVHLRSEMLLTNPIETTLLAAHKFINRLYLMMQLSLLIYAFLVLLRVGGSPIPNTALTPRGSSTHSARDDSRVSTYDDGAVDRQNPGSNPGGGPGAGQEPEPGNGRRKNRDRDDNHGRDGDCGSHCP
ncbi:hypothetical protein PtB15_6B864 [Puccinia triticina]|nr:hypothetical protein PtB15_6B864 [Puccinia triticina]